MRGWIAASLLYLSAAANAEAVPPTLVGDWQLVAAIPGSMQDSEPNGIRNLRLHFTRDGKVTMVDPTETLADAKNSQAWTVDGDTLELDIGEGRSMHAALAFNSAADASLTFAETGMAWTLHRLADGAIASQKLPAESVEYFPPSTPAAVRAFKYDAGDYRSLPAAERIQGQWEVVEVSGYGAGDFPPYGSPNDVWQFGKAQVRLHERNRPDEPPPARGYSVRGNVLQMEDGGPGTPVPYAFDEWQRLVIGAADGERTTLKRINRDGEGKVALPPLRIILGNARD